MSTCDLEIDCRFNKAHQLCICLETDALLTGCYPSSMSSRIASFEKGLSGQIYCHPHLYCSSFKPDMQILCFTEPSGKLTLEVLWSTACIFKINLCDWMNHLSFTLHHQLSSTHQIKRVQLLGKIKCFLKPLEMSTNIFSSEKSPRCRSLLFFQWRNYLHQPWISTVVCFQSSNPLTAARVGSCCGWNA